MLYHVHECITYHQSIWVTLYLVYSIRVDDLYFGWLSFYDIFVAYWIVCFCILHVWCSFLLYFLDDLLVCCLFHSLQHKNTFFFSNRWILQLVCQKLHLWIFRLISYLFFRNIMNFLDIHCCQIRFNIWSMSTYCVSPWIVNCFYILWNLKNDLWLKLLKIRAFGCLRYSLQRVKITLKAVAQTAESSYFYKF